MNLSDPSSGQDWRRLHPVAALSAVLRQLGAFLPLFVVALIGGRRADGPGASYWFLGLGVVVSAVAGIGGWWRYRYRVEGSELRVERGLIVRHRTFIDRSRVVAMDESASVIERVFGLVRLRIKTAAAGTQVELSAITRSESQRIQRLLSGAAEVESAPRAPDARYLLGTRDLILAASTSGRLGVLLSGIAWLVLQFDELFVDWIGERLVAFDAPNPLMLSVLGTLMLIVSWLVSIGFEIVKFGDFSLERRGNDLVVRRGLLERREVAIALDRAQAIVFVEGWLRQPFGFGSVVVESAGHAEEKGASTVLHPFLHRSEWLSFLARMAPEHAVTPEFVRPPRRALSRFLIRPLAYVLVLGLGLSAVFEHAFVLLLAIVPLTWLGLLRFRDTGASVVGRVLVLQSRDFVRRTAFVKRNAVQHAEHAVSFMQRRRALATFRVGVASGVAGIVLAARDLEDRTAAALLEWCSPSALARASTLGADHDPR